MLIVVVYDICTKDSDGRKRLNSVKTVCKNYGVSVQDSVFECELSFDLYQKMRIDIIGLIDCNQDSVIFYRISHDWRKHVERLGVKKNKDLYRDSFIL